MVAVVDYTVDLAEAPSWLYYSGFSVVDNSSARGFYNLSNNINAQLPVSAIEGGGEAYLYLVEARVGGGFAVQLIDALTTPIGAIASRNFTSEFELAGQIIITVGDDVLTLVGTGSDIEEPYAWTPDNSSEVSTFYNSLSGTAIPRSIRFLLDNTVELFGRATTETARARGRLVLTNPADLIGRAVTDNARARGRIRLTLPRILRGRAETDIVLARGALAVRNDLEATSEFTVTYRRDEMDLLLEWIVIPEAVSYDASLRISGRDLEFGEWFEVADTGIATEASLTAILHGITENGQIYDVRLRGVDEFGEPGLAAEATVRFGDAQDILLSGVATTITVQAIGRFKVLQPTHLIGKALTDNTRTSGQLNLAQPLVLVGKAVSDTVRARGRFRLAQPIILSGVGAVTEAVIARGRIVLRQLAPTEELDREYRRALTGGEEPIYALTATHPALSEPIRIVSDGTRHLIEGEMYRAVLFRVTPPQSRENEIRQTRLEIDNIGRPILDWVEASMGGRDTYVRVIRVVRLPPLTIDPIISEVVWEVSMEASVAEVSDVIAFTLTDEPIYGRPAVWIRHDPTTSPGIY